MYWIFPYCFILREKQDFFPGKPDWVLGNISNAVQEQECPGAPPLSPDFCGSFSLFFLFFFFKVRNLFSSYCYVMFCCVVTKETKNIVVTGILSLNLCFGGTRISICHLYSQRNLSYESKGLWVLLTHACKFKHTHRTVYKLRQQCSTNSRPLLRCQASHGACASSTAFFFFFFFHGCLGIRVIFAALPPRKWKCAICTLEIFFHNGDERTHRVVITPRCCQGIPPVFWRERETVLTLPGRWAGDDALLRPGCFTI